MGTLVYIAQWPIEGLGDKPLEAGDKIELTPDMAEPFVQGGSLKLEEKRGRKSRQETDDEPNGGTGTVTGTLAGTADTDGNVTPLAEMPEEQLRHLATELEIEGAETMTVEELVTAIEKEEVEIPETGTDQK